MHIGIDIKTFKNGRAGIQSYIRQLLDALQHADTTNEYTLYEPAPSDYVIVNPRWKKKTVASRLPGTLWLQINIPLILRKDRIDIFWGAEMVCPLYRLSPVKYVTSIFDFTFLRFPETMKLSTRIILAFTFRRVVSVSAALLPISDYIHTETVGILEKIPLKKTPEIITIPAGAPCWQLPQQYSSASRKDFLLFIGSIEPRKNLLHLISALEILSDSGKRPVLKIVSSGNWKTNKFNDKLARSPVKNQIELCGYLSTSQLQHQLSTCKALIFPSIYEGFGIPVVEALALDCLVLTSKNTVMAEIAGDAACYFDPLQPEDIAATISMIYEPSFRRETYLKHRNNVLSKFTWNKSALRLSKVFSSFDLRE
jgi:glycosyltransferase involved in cell wall biosynthesis